ncbi:MULTISPECIES: hemolysin family protein [Lactococcus]|jgi:putative hemolysin|uniref:Hemolysin family protein n=1 Tax=Lactococcus formosensis TaxID=1281486 RepID=A0A9X4NWB5_9LACT|nr:MULTISPECIES: hemolysin family protein [Lactococcus]MCH1723197.1 hemolysin family protein [Lactococcus formosensis]MCO7179647.1 hemolysin family protein [Lactococcus formosensis]MDG6110739.1 hemolysin family protein [Lactococcus formosensis]MDG6112922.1 hemolysin family protein [Lactococcus formosensis]MDG6115068.1 hemolysin family protein [Lactococcus formosensis]
MAHPDPESTSIILQILLLVFLTALNAFFSASEMALVSLSRSRVEQKASEGDEQYQYLLSVIDNPTHFLSTVQVGITFLNIVAGASLADTLAVQLAPLFGDTSFAQTLSKIIILVILTFFTIVFGELFPKRIAQALKEKAALKMVRPLMAIGVVLKPFIWLLTITINGLARIFPIKFDSSDDDMTRDEIEYLVHTDETALDDSEREMITGVFSLDELVAREIMVPRTDAFMIDINDDPRENIEKMLSESYSRVPVYDDDKDNILGIIHTKRILARGFADGFDNIDFREMLQEPLFVPETVFVDDLMLQMRNTQNQMAILLNEYGGVEGIVTLEDLIEEIVGEIEDETDIAEAEVHKIGENMYVVQGKMTINDFNDEFGTHLVNKDVDTMAGFFLSETGQIPEKGQQVMCKIDNLEDHFSLTSLEVDGNRILKLRVEFDVELPE